ncbi:MAG: glycosyltransferase family 39 protein [Candidatus Roizmanbacteria bacterium]|nr:MAG: glycosyltransferase family 39 protein [Candidatus Roizmanbacteria bacterium]
MFDLSLIYSFLKKTFKRKDILLITVLIILYLATRLINLDKFPIFSDEGIYIRWAKVAWHDASWRFISLTDGKQPLQTWATIPFLKLFPDNALFGARLFAVTTGFFALTGIFSLLAYLFGKKAAFLGAFFYIFTPFFLFYDRLALIDSGVNAFFIWILFLSIIFAKMRRIDVAFLFGLLGGLALLSKSSVRIFIGLAGLAPVLFLEKNIERFTKHLGNFIFLYIMASLLAIVIYNIQRLSPFFHYVSQKNTTFVMTFDEFFQNPFAVFFSNIKLIPLYISWEMGFFLSVFGIVGLFILYKRDKRLFVYFILWLVIPFFIVSFLSKVLFPRYIIFFGSLLLISSVYFFTHIKNKKIFNFLILGFVLSAFYYNYAILFKPQYLPFPPIDRGQYIEGWTAGWGMKEIIDFAREKSKEKPVVIVAEGNFGLAADVLDVFLKKDDRIYIRGYWPIGEKELLDHQKDLKSNYVFVVLAHQFDYPANWPLKLIKKIEKPGNESVTYLLELKEK